MIVRHALSGHLLLFTTLEGSSILVHVSKKHQMSQRKTVYQKQTKKKNVKQTSVKALRPS